MISVSAGEITSFVKLMSLAAAFFVTVAKAKDDDGISIEGLSRGESNWKRRLRQSHMLQIHMRLRQREIIQIGVSSPELKNGMMRIRKGVLCISQE